MKSEFNAMWERIVVRKPPWTLDDILFCLKKHWMSVFGNKLPKDALNLVDDIVEIFHKHMTKKGKDFNEIIKTCNICRCNLTVV
jgi:hypothetical protein